MSSVPRVAADALLGLVYPELCSRCERRIETAVALPVCPACLRRLPRPDPGEVAARLRERDGGERIATGAAALWRFDADGAVQRIQHRLKYAGHERIGTEAGRLLGSVVAASGSAPVDAVVPVPLSRVRHLERGYNQSASLSRGIADVLGVPLFTDALVRTRATRSQTRLAHASRWANVSGAFGVPSGRDLGGQHLLLVDDVLTTGATVLAAALPLLDAGATVRVAVLALAT